jgi:hypothetical protein
MCGGVGVGVWEETNTPCFVCVNIYICCEIVDVVLRGDSLRSMASGCAFVDVVSTTPLFWDMDAVLCGRKHTFVAKHLRQRFVRIVLACASCSGLCRCFEGAGVQTNERQTYPLPATTCTEAGMHVQCFARPLSNVANFLLVAAAKEGGGSEAQQVAPCPGSLWILIDS